MSVPHLPLDALTAEWILTLSQSKKSTNTITQRRTKIRLFVKWIEGKGYKHVNEIKARHIREYLAYRRDEVQVGDSTLLGDWTTLNLFFKWVMIEESEIFPQHPMTNIESPEYTPPIITFIDPQDIKALLDTCDNSFKGRRDYALMVLYYETGCRASELLQVEREDIQPATRTIQIHGKGGKERLVKYSDIGALALARYERVRVNHKFADSPRLFISERRPYFTYSGMRDVIRVRCDLAEIERHHLHELRHAFVHYCKQRGVSDDSLMELMGWDTRAMLDLYGRSMRRTRALEEIEGIPSPLDKRKH